MNQLLDTQSFLWFVSGDANLSKIAKESIENDININYISMASIWEISIKFSLGKLHIKGTYESVIDDINENGIILLPINFLHTLEQTKLPMHHRDPFDRIIASQVLVEKMNLISSDIIFDKYFATSAQKRIW
ncbi:MAG: type II toxin-antitoxin system VapC family toxin [Bacteroidota bacterium]